jgi:uncharacterized protein (DUF1697 family)
MPLPPQAARYVVLLRGVNVGKAKRIAMADLRAMLTDLGYTAVRTVLNSGNAVVTGADSDPDEHAAAVHAAIADRIGIDVRCLVLTGERLRAIVEGHPFADIADNGSRMFAHIMSAAPDPALLAGHDPVALDPHRARLGDRVIYQWCPDGLLAAPPVAAFAEQHLGVSVTARNWNTITKLLDLV